MRTKMDFFHKLYHYEYWPSWAFYFPVFLLWPYFALRGRSLLFFTVANPCIPQGGCFGESKYQILRLIHPRYLPETRFISSVEQIQTVEAFPLVAKPDVGERGDFVSVIRSRGELLDYFKKLRRPFILQEYLTSTFEAGVMVHRDPESRKLCITSVAVKGFLKVIGDGRRRLAELVQDSPRARFQWERLKDQFPEDLVPKKNEEILLEPIGNHCRGTTFINANDLITPELTAALEDALSGVEEFYFGRFDLKADSVEDLKQGQTIKVMELNGAFSEPGHIYDPREKLWRSWRDLVAHWNRLSSICGKNLKRGHRASTIFEFASLYADYRKLQKRDVYEPNT